jgi:very-short-patch-repair endonuclease
MLNTENKFASKQSRMLYDALQEKGIKAELEYSDGHKTVDIAILKAHLYIEVDGIQHFTNPEQIMRDFKRYHYSDGDDFSTFYVTNQIIDNHLDEVVNALVDVVKSRVK